MELRTFYSDADNKQVEQLQKELYSARKSFDDLKQEHQRSVVAAGENAETLRRRQESSASMMMLIAILVVSIILMVVNLAVGIIAFLILFVWYIFSWRQANKSTSDKGYALRKEFFLSRNHLLSEKGSKLRW